MGPNSISQRFTSKMRIDLVRSRDVGCVGSGTAKLCSLVLKYMGQNYQDGKYALFVSLFVSFHCDLESKWAIRELRKIYQVDQYTNGIALFLLKIGSI